MAARPAAPRSVSPEPSGRRNRPNLMSNISLSLRFRRNACMNGPSDVSRQSRAGSKENLNVAICAAKHWRRIAFRDEASAYRLEKFCNSTIPGGASRTVASHPVWKRESSRVTPVSGQRTPHFRHLRKERELDAGGTRNFRTISQRPGEVRAKIHAADPSVSASAWLPRNKSKKKRCCPVSLSSAVTVWRHDKPVGVAPLQEVEQGQARRVLVARQRTGSERKGWKTLVSSRTTHDVWVARESSTKVSSSISRPVWHMRTNVMD